MRCSRIAVAGLLLLGFSLPFCAAQQTLTLDQLVQKHLASMGTPEARAAVKTRVAEGTSKWEVITGGAGTVEGKATLVSDGRKVREVLRFTATNYRGEDLLTDGEKVQVSKGFFTATTPNEPRRSLLGEFLYNEPALLREGLLSGTLGTAWPLLDAKNSSAKLSYEGLKTVEGRQLHELKYVPKKRGDAEIRLYFDQDFRHVMTVVTMTLDPRIRTGSTASDFGDFVGRGLTTDGSRLTENARQQPVRYRLVETFGDFQQVDGLTLPTTCDVKFSAEGYSSSLVRYTMAFANVQSNVSLDPRNFQIK